ncbi:MAG TPA: hypothetical protein VF528_20925 [Pyrinomonadaceae bacterium]
MKPEHSLVFQALEAANLAYERVVTIGEIVEALSLKEIKRLKAIYSNDLSTSIKKILDLLTARDLVFSPGKIGRFRYYGSVNQLNPETAVLPTVQSRRRRVFDLVRDAVIEFNRAVRVIDILEYAATVPSVEDLTQNLITHDVLSLSMTGELSVVGSTRGGNEGINLYLPSEMDEEKYKPSTPLTWLEEVAHAVSDLWNERAKNAAAEKRRPRPMSTGEIRAHLTTIQFQFSPNPSRDQSQLIVDAVKNLSNTSNPVLRKIKRQGEKALLWVPIGIKNEELDLGGAYASDTERIGEAVKRATERLGRPVSVRDTKEEFEIDDALRPAGTSDLFNILADLSKETVCAGSGKDRQERVTRRIFRVGRVGGETYYCVDNLPEAQAYIKFRQLESRWETLKADEQLDSLETVSLPSVAVGRAMLITREVEQISIELNDLRQVKRIDSTTHCAAKELYECVCGIAETALQRLDSHVKGLKGLPTTVSTAVPVWTAQELLEFIKPLYPYAQKITSIAKFITLMGNDIRRVPNPDFLNRFGDDPFTAAEFLYDRTDALIYSAKKWGGNECSLQAMLAENELGWLRDPRFVFPALVSNNFETRLTGVSCLAFLQSKEGSKILRHIAVNDQYPGIRQSALWAYGFAAGDRANAFISRVMKNDHEARVRAFAKEMLETESWAM